MRDRFWSKLLLWSCSGVYGLAIVLVILGIRNVEQPGHGLLQVDQVELTAEGGPSYALTLYGEGFHENVNVLAAADMLAESSLQKHFLPGSQMRGLAVGDELVVVSIDGNNLIVARADDGPPKLPLGLLKLPHRVLAIEMIGQQALVSLSDRAGIMLVDLTDPSAPRIAQHIHGPGSVVRMIVSDSMVYCADYYRGLGRIDLNKSPLTYELVETSLSVWRMASDGDRLVTGFLGSSLQLFDINGKGKPIPLGTLEVPGKVRGLELSEDRLFVATLDGRLLVYDMPHAPGLPKLTATYDLGGRPHFITAMPGQPVLVASLSGSGLVFLDVTETGQLQLRRRLLRPRQYMEVAVVNDRVYAVSYEGLEIFSREKVLTRRSPQAEVVSPKGLELIEWGGHLYGYRDHGLVMLSENRGPDSKPPAESLAIPDRDRMHLHLYRMSAEGQPVVAANLNFDQGIFDASWRAGRLYVLHERSLRIYDGTDLEELNPLGGLDFSEKVRQLLWCDPGFLLVSTYNNGLMIVDVHEPARPRVVKSLRPAEHLRSYVSLRGMTCQDGYAYLAMGRGGVAVVNLQEPEDARIESVFITQGFARDVAIVDGFLWVADLSAGVYLFELGEAGAILQPVGSLPVPINARQVTVHDGSLYASSRVGGVIKMPVPRKIGTLDVLNSREAALALPEELLDTAQRFFLYDGKLKTEKYVSGETLRSLGG